MKTSWEEFLYKIMIWCSVIASVFLPLRLILFKSRPIPTPELEAIWLVMGGVACLAGTVLGVVLLWPLYKRVIFGNWPGRLLVGLLSLGILAVARILADATIVATTWLPAGWFPRSQDMLTGLLSVTVFLVVFIGLVGLLAVTSLFIAIVVDWIMGLIGVIPRKPRWHTWISQFSIYQKRREVIASFFATLLSLMIIAGVWDSVFTREKIEYLILWSSFVPNDEANADRGGVCKEYPDDTWLRFIDKNEVIAAVALGDAKERSRSFKFMVGPCTRDHPN
jgi:hypothetical protein